MALVQCELVQLWKCQSTRLRLLYSGWKPKQRGNPFISCHVWFLPFVLALWWTTMFSIILLSLYLHRTMDADAVLWNLNFVMFFNSLLLANLWCFAQSQYSEHCLSCHYHNHSKNCHTPGCSFCIRHGLRSSLFTCKESSWTSIAMMVLLFLQMLKCTRILVLVLLILLAGDVETNPGPDGLNVQDYVKSLPESIQHYLDETLDWDHDGVDTDLNAIAECMLEWEERFSSLLKLKDYEIADIKKTENSPELQRRKVLKKWKQHQGLEATYRNLLTVCCEARAGDVAGAICEVLRNRDIESNCGSLL